MDDSLLPQSNKPYSFAQTFNFCGFVNLWFIFPFKSHATEGCTRCYLNLPSGLTRPSSDLGSGLSELHAVWEQDCMTGQEDGPVVQMSTADQMLLAKLSTQLSSLEPISPAFFFDCSTCMELIGIFNTGFSPWKLCSM